MVAFLHFKVKSAKKTYKTAGLHSLIERIPTDKNPLPEQSNITVQAELFERPLFNLEKKRTCVCKNKNVMAISMGKQIPQQPIKQC